MLLEARARFPSSAAAVEGRPPSVGPGLRRTILPKIGETNHLYPEEDDEDTPGLPLARERPGARKCP
jgi:hypothetical protein